MNTNVSNMGLFLMDSLHNRLTFDLGKNTKAFTTARKRILRLVELQSSVENVVKYGKYSKALRSLQILYIFVLRVEKVTIFELKLPRK